MFLRSKKKIFNFGTYFFYTKTWCANVQRLICHLVSAMSFLCLTHNDARNQQTIFQFFFQRLQLLTILKNCFYKSYFFFGHLPRAKYTLSDPKRAHFVTKQCCNWTKSVRNGFYAQSYPWDPKLGRIGDDFILSFWWLFVLLVQRRVGTS